MGAPFTGRVNAIIPFFPFTKAEQAVVAHSFLLAELRKCRRPINLAQDKLIGDLHISTCDDGKLCSLLAERHYDPDLGARSLAQAVTDDVMIPLVELYLEPPGNEGLGRGPRADVALEKYALHVGSLKTEDGDEEQEIVMKRDGETKLKSVGHKVNEELFSALESWKFLEQGTFTMIEDVPPSNGTAGVPFAAAVDTESNSLQSISFMQPYQRYSFEELRQADYNAGRRYGSGAGQAGGR